MKSLLERESATGRQVDWQENQWCNRWGRCMQSGVGDAGLEQAGGDSKRMPLLNPSCEVSIYPDWEYWKTSIIASLVDGLQRKTSSSRQRKKILFFHSTYRSRKEVGIIAQVINVSVEHYSFSLTIFQSWRPTLFFCLWKEPLLKKLKG